MAVHAGWDDQVEHVIRYDFEGRWTWDEFEQAYHEVAPLFASVDAEVGVIVNLLPSTALQRGILDVLKRVADDVPPNHGVTVFVGERDVLKAFARAFERIYPTSARRYRLDYCVSLDEARARLRSDRPGVG
jgi:hypothetical protein